ncbi:momilactone A synthase-like isoform X1 [Curcuma longa]|uniref:momilactone A synthase-like isoform X1 n=1 Tax=Curcuma longa TaxID=136217 RepID=UPI003D9F9082
MLGTALRFKRGLAIRTGIRTQQQQFSTHPTPASDCRLEGKVAIITGAASGVGKATAAEFIHHGAQVVLADIQHELGESVAAELGPGATFVPCDVTQEPQVAAVVDLAVAKHGRLDIMYNNAGICGPMTFAVTDVDLTEFDRVMAVNVRSVVAGIKHAARVMVPRRAGSILCTASITGLDGGLAPLAYSLSKAAVAAAVRLSASELSKHGIRVNCISPASLPTPFGIKAVREIFPDMEEQRAVEMIELAASELAGTKCEVEDVAKAATFLASDEAKYISGHNLVVDGGFTTSKCLNFSR